MKKIMTPKEYAEIIVYPLYLELDPSICEHVQQRIEQALEDSIKPYKEEIERLTPSKPDKIPEQRANEALETIKRTQELNRKLRELGVLYEPKSMKDKK